MRIVIFWFNIIKRKLYVAFKCRTRCCGTHWALFFCSVSQLQVSGRCRALRYLRRRQREKEGVSVRSQGGGWAVPAKNGTCSRYRQSRCRGLLRCNLASARAQRLFLWEIRRFLEMFLRFWQQSFGSSFHFFEVFLVLRKKILTVFFLLLPLNEKVKVI